MTTLHLSELADIETKFGDKAVDDVRRAANVLLRRQFLFAGDRGSAQFYTTLTAGRYQNYFAALFDALGYRYWHNGTEQWVGILPDPTLDVLPRMKLDHTITLLLLALSWQSGINQGDVEQRACVPVSFNELFEKYRDIAGRSRKSDLKENRMMEVLKDFQYRGLVDIGDYDPELDDVPIMIRPMVPQLVDGHALDKLEAFAADMEGALDLSETATAATETPPADIKDDADIFLSDAAPTTHAEEPAQ
jgi:hypothetical protein